MSTPVKRSRVKWTIKAKDIHVKLQSFTVSGVIAVDEKIVAANRYAAVRAFYEKHKTVPGSCGKDEVYDLCEACGLPIFVDQKYHFDEDGIHWHKRCPKNK